MQILPIRHLVRNLRVWILQLRHHHHHDHDHDHHHYHCYHHHHHHHPHKKRDTTCWQRNAGQDVISEGKVNFVSQCWAEKPIQNDDDDDSDDDDDDDGYMLNADAQEWLSSGLSSLHIRLPIHVLAMRMMLIIIGTVRCSIPHTTCVSCFGNCVWLKFLSLDTAVYAVAWG